MIIIHYLCPGEILLASAKLKVAFYDAEINLQICSKYTSLCRHKVPIPLKAKLLLVDSSRSKQGCLNAVLEPHRGVCGDVADVGGGFALVRHTLGFAIIERNDDDFLLIAPTTTLLFP